MPTIAAVPMVAEVVVQFKSILLPASALGGVLSTFTVTTSVHKPFTDKVYVVVVVGLAVGCATVDELSPVAGVQL